MSAIMPDRSLEAYFDINPIVQSALDEGRPVVALESTIISHGMPYPQNVDTALQVEQVVRDHHAVPATMAILRGRLKVGLSRTEIEYLGKAGQAVTKTSRRDIPFMVAGKKDGATTVASTMILADRAGIRIFATGGIGGVHRGAPQTLDMSADLQELAHTDVAVVCAGVKSILDIGLTLEYLETHGVPVIGYQTEMMPAFYTRDSDFIVNYKLDSPEEIARVMKAKWEMNLSGGMIIANPIPAAHSLDRRQIDGVIDQALLDMEKIGMTGKDCTPYLLARIAETTEGESLAANIQLVFNNAALAAEIAVEYASLQK